MRKNIFSAILAMVLVCGGIQPVNAQRKVTINTDFDGSGRGSSKTVTLPSKAGSTNTSTQVEYQKAMQQLGTDVSNAIILYNKEKRERKAEEARIKAEEKEAKGEALGAKTREGLIGEYNSEPKSIAYNSSNAGNKSNSGLIQLSTSISNYAPKQESTVYESDRGYGLLCGIATEHTGRDFPLSKGEYLRCIVNQLENHDTPECKEVDRKYQQFWHDVISKNPEYKLYQDMVDDLVETGIDIANIWVSCGVAIGLGPTGRIVIAGPQAAVVTLLKELNRGKQIDDLEMWLKVAQSGAVAFSTASIKANINTGSPMRDAIGKAIVDMGVEAFNGEGNTKILETGAKGTFMYIIDDVFEDSPIYEAGKSSVEAAKRVTKLPQK